MRWSTLRRGRSSPATIMSSIRASLVSSTRRRRRSSSVDVALVHASSVVRQTLMRGFVQLSDLRICVALAVFLVDLIAPTGRGTGLCLERDCFPRQCLAALWPTGRGLGQLYPPVRQLGEKDRTRNLRRTWRGWRRTASEY